MRGAVPIRVMLACSIGLVVVGCSSPSTSDTTSSRTALGSAPIHTYVQQRFQRSWEPADNPGETEAEINAALENSDGSILLPQQMPPQTSHSTARLSVKETAPEGAVVVDLYVAFTHDGQENSLSLTRLPATAEGPDCDGRITRSAGGIPGWDAITVRDSTGCTVTNESGLGFIEWEEASSRFHVETPMDVNEALSWLQTWKHVP